MKGWVGLVPPDTVLDLGEGTSRTGKGHKEKEWEKKGKKESERKWEEKEGMKRDKVSYTGTSLFLTSSLLQLHTYIAGL